MNRMSTSGREKQAERERARIATQRSAEPLKETEGILRLASDFLPDTYVVTHADYRALEEELAALRVRVGGLSSAAKDMSNVLTKAMLNTPIPVHRSANAIQRVESALEALA